jgi:hypothetical protein
VCSLTGAFAIGGATRVGASKNFGATAGELGGRITTESGFAAANAAIARGFVNGMTFGGGVVASFIERDGFAATDGIAP